METLQAIKIVRDRRYAYLMAVEQSYKELGYTTRLDGMRNILEVFDKGCIIPKTEQEIVIERWID
jgi:hypothetical protein